MTTKGSLSEPPHNRGNILVVDDKPENLRLLYTMLTKHGYKARPATNGQLAIQSARHTLPDLILLDIIMPGMDGYQVCRILKGEAATRDIPVIFISALEEEEDKSKAFKAGGVDYLTKPFHESEVLARINTHLTLYKMQQDLENVVGQRTEELRATYHEIKNSEAKYRSLFNDALDMIHIVDNTGRITDVNPIELKTLGYTKDEFLDKTLADIIHPDLEEKTSKVFRQVMAGQEVRNYETVLITKEGQSIDVEANVVPLIENGGGVVSARAILHDITERKKTAAALQRSHDRYRQAQDISQLGHWELDLLSQELSWSEGIFRIFEVNPDGFGASYQAFLKFVHPEDRELVISAFNSSLQDRTKYDLTHRLLLPGGQVKYVHEQGRTDYDEAGKPLRSLGTVQDVTKLKLAEDKTRQAKEEWERTFQAIGDIATILDPDLRITRVNRKACEVFVLKPEEMEGKLCYELFRGVAIPCEGCPAVKSINDFKVHTAEIEHKELNKTFEVSASPVLDPAGQLSGIVHFARDITEQKQLEGQLRQAQKMEAIGTLAGGIAHDFNNILTPILGYAEMTLDTIPKENPAVSEIHEVLKAANRAKDLVKQILTFSRQTEKEMQPLNIQFVIKEALKLLRASIPTTIEIRQNIDKECAAVLADPTQVHQITMNLCTNAYHAMRDKGGIMSVSLRQVELRQPDLQNKLTLPTGEYIMLEVSDTGQGMDKIMVDKIFDPYFTTKAKGEGTGLGLSVVLGIVKSLHGEITVYSELEQGTSIHIYLPAIESEPQQARGATDTILPCGHERILVLDDEEIIVDMERQMLASLGYQVTVFADSEEALATFHSDPESFDLIITDMTMPKITGADLAKEILLIRPELPIIMCTGFSELISEDKAKAIGIREFIMKPILKKDLAILVRKALDRA